MHKTLEQLQDLIAVRLKHLCLLLWKFSIPSPESFRIQIDGGLEVVDGLQFNDQDLREGHNKIEF